MRNRLVSSRLAAVGVLGLLLLNSPLLSLVDLPRRVFGIPVLWVYLYGVWVLMIVLVALVVRKEDRG
jgi:hypothetical protein